MNKFTFYLLLFVSLQMPTAFASNVISDYVNNAKVVGEGRLTYLFWDVYDATLMAPNGDWQADQPFALKLDYLRELEGKKIAERSVDEMRALGVNNEIKLATWHSQMRKIFPDVKQGSSIVGIRDKQGNAIFYSGDTLIGRIDDAEFSDAFFNIWLSDSTSSPKLRRKLLNQ